MENIVPGYTHLHKVGAFLACPATIIAVFVVPKFYLVFSAFTQQPPRNDIGIAITVETVILLGLSYFVIRGNTISSWVMAVYMWLQGLGSCVLIFAPRFEGWQIKALSIVLGLYYIAGGLVLVKRIKHGQPNQAL